MIEIHQANTTDIPAIQELSNIVWPPTFADILSPEQIEYMMKMMYSTASLLEQMATENLYYALAKENDAYLAFLSYQTNIENVYTKIHKIYVLPNMQSKGLGKMLINYAAEMTKRAGDKMLRLNVNRNNKALDFYKRMGFSIEKVENIDIGNGYLMEDYVMKIDI